MTAIRKPYENVHAQSIPDMMLSAFPINWIVQDEANDSGRHFTSANHSLNTIPSYFYVDTSVLAPLLPAPM